jgi:hypothetical protein
MQVADQQAVDRKGVAASANTLKVKRCIPEVQLLHDRRWPDEIITTAGWKIFFVSRAAYRRNDYVKSVGTDETNPVPQEKKIDPAPFHAEMGDGTDWRKVGGRVAAQRDAIGYESGVGKVRAVVALNLDFAGKYFLEEWLDIPIPEWPMQVHESDGQHETNEAGNRQAQHRHPVGSRFSGHRGVERGCDHSEEFR